MITSPKRNERAAGEAWFCVRTKPKQEQLAARHLAGAGGLEVYLPRVRFRRSTRRGPVWFTEALFPGYLFARFNLAARLRHVHHSPSVQGVVHFGNQWPAIPEEVIEELRSTVAADQVCVIHETLQPGDEVRIAGGAMHSLRAVVARVMPARERVAVLLEFLGRQSPVEVARSGLIREGERRKDLFARATRAAPNSSKSSTLADL